MRQIKFPVFKLRVLGVLFLISSVTSATVAAPDSNENQWRSGEDPENLTKLEQVGLIHPALPKTKLLSAQESIFEIERDSKSGDEVTGRVNLANNSFEQAKFFITGGSGKGIFVIETFENSRGKSFGVIKLASADHSEDTYTLKVKAKFATGVTDEEVYRIDFVPEPFAKRFFGFVEKWIGRQGRLATKVSDSDIEVWLERMRENGEFSDLPLSTSKDGWENTCTSAERLLAISIAYLDQDSRFQKDDELKANLYRGIVRNAEQNGLFRTNWAETHVWRNSDFIAGIGLRFIHILRDEMEKEVGRDSRLATQAYDAILDVCDLTLDQEDWHPFCITPPTTLR